MEALEKAEQLKNELDNLRPLNAETEARIMQKFRLDWNYHSNKLEGNSYTYGETKMLLLKGLTAGGKPVKDHEEISGHNEAIDQILDAVKENIPLTETFIRHLNKLVLVKPRWTKAKTADGQPTKKLIKVGEYKTEPNHVETETGIFYFTEPFETPAKMQELVEWFREKQELQETNPIVLAAEFHYRFVRIHPFDDGNGRVARLLMNFILTQFGYPPVIIKNEDKQNYLAVLEQADFHILEPFVEYIAQNLVRSLEVMIRGAQGEDIEEPGDIDKELAFLERRLSNIGDHVQKLKTQESILDVFDNSIIPLVSRLAETTKKFERFYKKRRFVVLVRGGDTTFHSETFSVDELRAQINSSVVYTKILFGYNNLIQVDTIENFSYNSVIEVEFDLQFYVVKGTFDKSFRKNYSEYLSEEEIESIIKSISKGHKNAIGGVLDKVQSKLD